MAIKKFKDFIAEGIKTTRDKKVDHIEDNEPELKSDSKLEDVVDDYIEDKRDECPRCGNAPDECKCQDSDPWSTQNFHRVPKGEKTKAKPKQNFKS